ncbi:hypothetical protein C1E24_04410 [Pseudoalteromonas phenolica]|uniref:Uncharacterized protein n=1 Tax=Pseudoalteromonas phenolica TaxID=161398 RepID=A0A5R9Q4H6_9GAMM|nr:hypothetical protein C1E24_04410 [Pseudoalteromonas phenolica]
MCLRFFKYIYIIIEIILILEDTLIFVGTGLFGTKKARYKIALTFQVKNCFAVSGGASHIPRSDFHIFKP